MQARAFQNTSVSNHPSKQRHVNPKPPVRCSTRALQPEETPVEASAGDTPAPSPTRARRPRGHEGTFKGSGPRR